MIRTVYPILVLLSTLTAAAVGEEIAVSPQFGVLELRRGQLLEGHITLAGDRFLVSVSSNGQVYVPVEDVQYRGRDRIDIYRQKALDVRPGSFDAHLELANWCARYGLPTQATEQSNQAASLRPNDPRLATVQRRMTAARQSTPVHESGEKPAAVSAVDLQEVTSSLPPGTVEMFTSTIQPILINSCANGACHGPYSKSSYQLLRPALGRPLTQRFTQRNLHATIQQIDRNAPEQSVLLKALETAHGTATSSFRQTSARHYDVVVDWVKQAARRTTVRRPNTLGATSDRLLQTAGNLRYPGALVTPELETESNTQVDPYDPAEFNRQLDSAE